MNVDSISFEFCHLLHPSFASRMLSLKAMFRCEAAERETVLHQICLSLFFFGFDSVLKTRHEMTRESRECDRVLVSVKARVPLHPVCFQMIALTDSCLVVFVR